MEDVAGRVLERCPIVAWRGSVWRTHSRRFQAGDVGGSRVNQGRWHRGGRAFPLDQSFAALYTAVSDAVATWEMIRPARRPSADEMWARFSANVLSQLRLDLAAVLDLRDPSCAGLTLEVLTGADYTLTQAIAAGAFAHGLEGLLVPSATGVGEPGRDYNVVVFPDNLRAESRIEHVLTRTPGLPP